MESSMNNKNKKELKEAMSELTKNNMIEEARGSFNNRARSLSVGTAFGGIIEISMRKNNGESVYVFLQPVECIELIHQLSASVGCHINLQPRQDFSSWREWKKVDDVLLPMDSHQNRGAVLPPPEQQPGLLNNQVSILSLPEQQPETSPPERNHLESVATKKTVNRLSIKQSPTST